MTDAQQKPASIDDMVGYQAEKYFSPEEVKTIRLNFSGTHGQELIRLIRKIFLASINDEGLPVEEWGKDLYMGQIDFKSLPADEAKAAGMGLQLAHKGLMGGIIMLKQIASSKEETEVDAEQRRAKDSAK